jgi:hypothetical protein
MGLIQKASELGYKHYSDFTTEELDKLPLNNPNKLIEYFFIQKWLRDEHKIYLSSTKGYDSTHFRFEIYFSEDEESEWELSTDMVETYENALEDALELTIETMQCF